MASGIRLGHVYWTFGVDTGEFDRRVKGVRQRLYNLNRTMRPVTAAAKRLAVGFTASALAIAYLGRETAETIDRQSKLAQSLQTTTTSIAALERAAELSGIAARQLEAGLRQMSTQLSRLADGSAPTELQEAFNRLGLSARALAELPVDQRIAEIQQAITRLIPPAERAAVAAQLFGARAGLAFARLDAKVIRTAAEDIRRFGGALDETASDEVERMNDAISSLGTGFRAIRSQIVLAAAPAIADFAERLSHALETGSDFRNSLAAVSETIGAALPRIRSYALGFAGVVLTFKALHAGALLLERRLLALRAAMVRTGFLIAVAAAGELVHRLTAAEEGTDAYGEANRRLGDIIRGTNLAQQHHLRLTNAEVTAKRNATEAALENAKARLRDAEAAMSQRRQEVATTAAYKDALARYTEAVRERDALGGQGKAASAFDTHRMEVNRRLQKAARDLRALLDVSGDEEIEGIKAGIAHIEGKLAALDRQVLVPEAPIAAAGSVAGGNPEKTAEELKREREALTKRIEDAELAGATELERRLKAIQRERAEVLKGLDHEGAEYERLRDRAVAAYAEMERHARGQVSALEQIRAAADELGGHFGNFAAKLSIDFKAIRDEGEALNDLLKELGNSVANTLSQKVAGDNVANAISTAISGGIGGLLGGGGATVNPHTRAGGGYARGWTMVGEQGRELAYFGREAKIHSNRRTEQMLRGGAGGHVSVGLDVAVGGDLDSVQQAIDARLAGASTEIAEATYAMVEQNIGRPSNLRTESRT